MPEPALHVSLHRTASARWSLGVGLDFAQAQLSNSSRSWRVALRPSVEARQELVGPLETDLTTAQLWLRETMGRLATIRGANPVLARGRRVPVVATRDVLAYRMAGCGEDFGSVLVAINKGEDAESIDIGPGSFNDLLSPESGPSTGGRIVIPARTARILRR